MCVLLHVHKEMCDVTLSVCVQYRVYPGCCENVISSVFWPKSVVTEEKKTLNCEWGVKVRGVVLMSSILSYLKYVLLNLPKYFLIYLNLH